MSAPTPMLSGELGSIGLFDLAQLLVLNRVTGRLAVESEGGQGYLYFREGGIVNAVDDEMREGEVAAHRVFSWKQGRFAFTAETVTGDALIETGPESLMLEAARRMDESAESAGATPGEEEQLVQRQDSMGALRQAFSELASEAQAVLPGLAATAPGVELGALQRLDDRLVLSPGHHVRLRSRGHWKVVRERPLSRKEYEHLRERLLGSEPAAAPGGGTRATIVRLPAGRAMAVTRVAGATAESLWLRPVELAPPAGARLIASPEEMLELTAFEHGLVLASGMDPGMLQEVLHALIGARLARDSETVLLVQDVPTFRHPQAAGTVLECLPEGLAGCLAMLEPGTLALDTATVPDGSLRTLERVQVIVARVRCRSHEGALATWRASLAPADRASVEVWLSTAPTLLVSLQPGGASSATLGISVHRIGRAASARPSGTQGGRRAA